MKIEYKDGKMIITHPSGVVNECDKADILRQRHAVELDILAAQDEIKYHDACMAKIDKSVVKLSLFTKLRKLVTRRS